MGLEDGKKIGDNGAGKVKILSKIMWKTKCSNILIKKIALFQGKGFNGFFILGGTFKWQTLRLMY